MTTYYPAAVPVYVVEFREKSGRKWFRATWITPTYGKEGRGFAKNSRDYANSHYKTEVFRVREYLPAKVVP